MTHTCPKCGAKIVVETDDRKHAEKRIEKWKKYHKCKGGESIDKIPVSDFQKAIAALKSAKGTK